MERFLYCRDPLFLIGCAAYALNRWVLKPHTTNSFLHGYFNDFWLIPCALPPILWLHRRLGLRADDRNPRLSELALHLVFWSVLFEYIGPKIMPHTVGDPLDVLAYTGGAILAGIWWHRRQLTSRFASA
jgi:hypothetical protein